VTNRIKIPTANTREVLTTASSTKSVPKQLRQWSTPGNGNIAVLPLSTVVVIVFRHSFRARQHTHGGPPSLSYTIQFSASNTVYVSYFFSLRWYLTSCIYASFSRESYLRLIKYFIINFELCLLHFLPAADDRPTVRLVVKVAEAAGATYIGLVTLLVVLVPLGIIVTLDLLKLTKWMKHGNRPHPPRSAKHFRASTLWTIMQFDWGTTNIPHLGLRILWFVSQK